MKRTVQIAVVTAMSVALLSWGAFMAAQSVAVNGGQAASTTTVELNTSSPNWKFLSEDVGVMIRKDDRLGLRGRLFVRVNDAWMPVAIDGLGDVLGSIPAR